MLICEAVECIEHDVNEYKAAEDTLLKLEAIALKVEELCAEDLLRLETLKKRIADTTQRLIAEQMVDMSEKEAEAAQKTIRKRLFEPMVVLVDSADYPGLKGKTFTQDAYAVTLVESKPEITRNAALTDIEHMDAHRADVQGFIDAGLHSLLSISTEDAAVGYIDARAKSGNPLLSVALKRDGYCKVKLS